MSRWFVLAAVGVASLAIGGALGMRIAKRDAPPAEVRAACGLVSEAYTSASLRADAYNERDGEENLAHPWRPSEAWGDSEQRKIEAAVVALEPITWPSEWITLAITIENASRQLDPASSSDGVSASAALSAAQAACIGR